MALTPLTPAQVGGSLDTGEIRALHVSGPNVGQVLVYKSDDPALQAAHESGDVVVEGLPQFLPPSDPPTFVTLPVVTGSATVGGTVSVSNGTWTNNPTSFAYQWMADGNGGDIPGATGQTYVVTAAEVDKTIGARVTAVNAAGSNTVSPVPLGPVPAPSAADEPAAPAPASTRTVTRRG
jgi:hypothetical protein